MSSVVESPANPDRFDKFEESEWELGQERESLYNTSQGKLSGGDGCLPVQPPPARMKTGVGEMQGNGLRLEPGSPVGKQLSIEPLGVLSSVDLVPDMTLNEINKQSTTDSGFVEALDHNRFNRTLDRKRDGETILSGKTSLSFKHQRVWSFDFLSSLREIDQEIGTPQGSLQRQARTSAQSKRVSRQEMTQTVRSFMRADVHEELDKL